MLGTFAAFLKEVERVYPYLYRRGSFSDLEGTLAELSGETTEAGIRISDLAVGLVKEPGQDLYARLYHLGKLREKLIRLGPEGFCDWMDKNRIRS